MCPGDDNGFYLREKIETLKCSCDSIGQYLTREVGHIDTMPGITLGTLRFAHPTFLIKFNTINCTAKLQDHEWHFVYHKLMLLHLVTLSSQCHVR